jgi:hypothetical protein
MKIENISYLPPEGLHTGTITTGDLYHDVKNGKERESVRFTLALDPVAGDRLNKYMARIDYWASQSGQLYEDLRRLIGAKVDDLVDDEGMIVPERLSMLAGKRVSFQIVHENRPGHQHAYRKVINLRPAPSASVNPNRIQFKRAA